MSDRLREAQARVAVALDAMIDELDALKHQCKQAARSASGFAALMDPGPRSRTTFRRQAGAMQA